MGMNKMLCDKTVVARRSMQTQFTYAGVKLLNSYERTEMNDMVVNEMIMV
jgi:hypothetical protein